MYLLLVSLFPVAVEAVDMGLEGLVVFVEHFGIECVSVRGSRNKLAGELLSSFDILGDAGGGYEQVAHSIVTVVVE